MKKQRKKGSGRKPGDGVLQNLDPASPVSEKMRQLTYGRVYTKRVFDPVLWFRNRSVMVEHFEKSGDETQRKLVDKHTNHFVDRLRQEMVNALFEFKPDWFQEMADAIRSVRGVSQELYPLHSALHDLFEDGSRYTIAEICDLLKKRGKRVSHQMDDASWKVMVRRACDQIGFPYLPGKPGRKRKQS